MIWSDGAFLALRDFSLSSTQTLSSLGLSGKTADHVSEVEVGVQARMSLITRPV